MRLDLLHVFWSETSKVHSLGQDFRPLYFWQSCICAACLKLQNANWSLFSSYQLTMLLWENIWSQLILLHWENISSQLILLLWENISLSSAFLLLHRTREAAVNRWRLISMPWTRSTGNPHKSSINFFFSFYVVWAAKTCFTTDEWRVTRLGCNSMVAEFKYWECLDGWGYTGRLIASTSLALRAPARSEYF